MLKPTRAHSFATGLKNRFVAIAFLALLCVAISQSAFAEEESENEEKGESSGSLLWPEWKPAAFGVSLRPVLGFQYSTDAALDAGVGQAEIGAHVGVQGIPIVAGNPGLQVEPGIGYAVGQAVVKESGRAAQDGTYRRVWGGVRTPIYYRFFRQVFEGRYGVVSGGPLALSKRGMFQSDSAVAIIPHLSAHYTFTFDRSTGEETTAPELRSYEHWLHARLSADTLSFFVDAGPGYTTSKSTVPLSSTAKKEGTTSGMYLLALSGFDLFTNRIGFEAQAKYIFTSNTDTEFVTPGGRSPLDDLGAEARRVGMPADSFRTSAFFGFRRLMGAFGLGWRYSLEILNLNERDGSKRERSESNGLGLYASVNF